MAWFRKPPSTDIAPTSNTDTLERATFQQLVNQLQYAGQNYQLPQTYQSWGKGEPPPNSFSAYVTQGYLSNAVVFACVLARQLVFSEARFAYQRYIGGRPGDLFGDQSLAILERPWPNGTTGELLARCEQDASLGGNSYWVRRGDHLKRLRPDWVTIVLGSEYATDNPFDGETEIAGYAYIPGGRPDARPILYTRDEVAHYSPIPDPLATYRGMSWLTPILREIGVDTAATDHKLAYFVNGATPNAVLTSSANLSQHQLDELATRFGALHNDRFRTVVLTGGLDLQVIGNTFEQSDIRNVIAAGETRIAAAAGVPPVIVGLSEGLAAATYSNYSQARRRFADGTMRPLWRIAASSFETLVPPPTGAHLTFDDRDIAFLREDAADAADIQSTNANTVKTLVDAGFDPASAVDAVMSGDLRRIKDKHTGMTSVQLTPPNPGAVA